jgi:sulfur carrier protein
VSITVNGKVYEVDGPTTVDGLLRHLDQARDDIAIAVDGAVVPRSAWSDTPIGDDAVVEIVTARQGG